MILMRSRRNYRRLADRLGTKKPDFTEEKEQARQALLHAREVIGDTPGDGGLYLYFPDFKLVARMLLEYGFRVTEIFADAFSAGG